MFILKLGGSIITKKDSSSEVDFDNLRRIAKEIKKANVNDLIIVHGAGSFGHPPAKKYAIGEKFSKDEYPKKRIGFCLTENEVKKLNMFVCEVLIAEGIPAVAICPSSVLTATDKRINPWDKNLVKKYIEKGYVPVMFGDVVLDDNLEMVVVSGDQIIKDLAISLKADKVILSTDVDGVFNKNPKTHDDAILFEKFTSLEDLDSFEGTTNIDVTGGMIGKIKELLALADLGIESEIINANVKDNIYKVLISDEVIGTLISKRD